MPNKVYRCDWPDSEDRCLHRSFSFILFLFILFLFKKIHLQTSSFKNRLNVNCRMPLLCRLTLCSEKHPRPVLHYPGRGVLFGKRNEARYRLRLIPLSVIQTLCSLQRTWKDLPSSRKNMRVRQPRKQEYSWCRIRQQDSWRGGIPARPSMMKSSALMRYMHFHSSMNRRQRDENYPS